MRLPGPARRRGLRVARLAPPPHSPPHASPAPSPPAPRPRRSPPAPETPRRADPPARSRRRPAPDRGAPATAARGGGSSPAPPRSSRRSASSSATPVDPRRSSPLPRRSPWFQKDRCRERPPSRGAASREAGLTEWRSRQRAVAVDEATIRRDAADACRLTLQPPTLAYPGGHVPHAAGPAGGGSHVDPSGARHRRHLARRPARLRLPGAVPHRPRGRVRGLDPERDGQPEPRRRLVRERVLVGRRQRQRQRDLRRRSARGARADRAGPDAPARRRGPVRLAPGRGARPRGRTACARPARPA